MATRLTNKRIDVPAFRKVESVEELLATVKEIDNKKTKTKATLDKNANLKKAEEELILTALGDDILDTSNPEIATYLGLTEESQEKEVKEWDVTKDMHIDYFDPTLSYEITGYRPITKTQGLDFDPKPFCEAGRIYEETGKYTSYMPGTLLFRNFWYEEFRRCKEGMTIGRYTITGDNYYWLNYYRLLNVVSAQAAKGRTDSFPIFLNKQYEYFHYIELCKVLGKDFCALKSRGVGASEIACALGANMYTTIANSRTVYTCKTTVLLEPTLEKVWQLLDFLNGETQGGFKHLRMKLDTSMAKRASKVDKDGVESGHMAIIEGIVADKPRKLRGRRCEYVLFEESGSFPDLIETYVQAEPLVNILGKRVGIRLCFGTGGDLGAGLAGLSKMFYQPEVYNVLPYKNNYTENGEYVYTGFFIPAYTMWFGVDGIPGYDERGVVDEEAAKEYYEKERQRMANEPGTLIKYKAEYCFTPEEALILEGENRFNQELLVEQVSRIQLHKDDIEKPKKATLHWGLLDGLVDRNSMPTIEYVPSGKIEILEEPLRDESGIPFRDLYVAGIDSIDSDESTSSNTSDLSKFCIVILRRRYGTKPPRVVAMYTERPSDVRFAYDNALKLCEFYNAKALLEATRINLKAYWELFKKLDYLMRRPKATIKTNKLNSKQFGVPATPDVIDHQLYLIETYINDYYELIWFPGLLDELLRYSETNKRKFDRVAAFAMALLADEDLLGKVPKATNSQKYKEINSIGYYKDSNGLIRYGIKPSRPLDDGRYSTFGRSYLRPY